ncbi:hypothetical protein P3X46_023027 [Hevea brasiliensis]|uniref:Uncharacterized protein n=1 Tax=Hevea brasiliensis TaxID=3981 RepID=A0ABQ9L9P9_HEVBR|nr:zinc finger protein CONSTANS-LIKE 6 [Hevea brasiliensis]KAJ9163350.1 hypothetical protein P3X46_023027 [Hevea brasiliensis]
MISKKNVANAVGGKTARACDSCIRKRARWYCAADDAFLCQVCDSSVHSANHLAHRHKRVRLKTASFKSLDLVPKENCAPSWHHGFTRKARTPRHGKPVSHSKIEKKLRNPIPLVPEVGSDEISHGENEEEQLLYRVPVFDPFVAQLCNSTTISNNEAETTTAADNDSDQTVADANGIESKASLGAGGKEFESLHGFLPSDMDLAEFAADVESLLGRGLENESVGMEELGIVGCKEQKELQREYYVGRGMVKLEDEREGIEKEEEAVRDCYVDTDETEMAREPPFELSFDYDSATCGEEDEKVGTGERDLKNNEEYEDDGENLKKKKKKRKILLKLDYEAVITAWASQGSPWTTGNRPDIDPDECWPEYWMGICGAELHHDGYGDHTTSVGVQHPTMADGGREARVSRYREKRRTRLFSKKIRYEVRKLNAEKRPRMKGRFVKKASFAGP